MNCLYGVLSGLCVGLMIALTWEVFDLMPAMLYMIVLKQMNFFPLIANAYGVSEEAIGYLLHFITSGLLGLLFALIFHNVVKGVWNGIGVGFLFGAVWWLLTPFYLMPFFFAVPTSARWSDLTMYELMDSLLSHVLLGVFLGLFYALFLKLLKKQARSG